MLFLLGSDPELFVGDQTSVRSAIGKFGGTKDKPRPVTLGKGFSVQEDNVLLEFNTPPAKSGKAWSENHARMMDFLKEEVAKKDLVIYPGASYTMPEEELACDAAWIFGCDPDFNVWTGKMNPRPFNQNKMLRSAGGHIHIGRKMTNTQKILLVRWLDLFISTPLVLCDPDTERRKLYGQAGAMRFKPYGLEYRTPSNWWVVNGKYDWVYGQVVRAFRHLGSRMDPVLEDLVKESINNNNKDTAKEAMQLYRLEVPR